MEDFWDDFMDEEFFEDSFEEDMEMSEPPTGDFGLDDDPYETDSKEDEPEQADSQDDFTARDAFFLGSAIGWGYKEGLKERKLRKRKKFSDDSK